jgi:[protein-PII] uridylyltransferase
VSTAHAAPVVRLRGELAALERAYSPGHHGLWSARRRAELADRALVELYEAVAPAAPRTALAALGGYGRGALAPASDLDLVILHDETDPDAVAALAERLLYPLWDADFTVGHAVRTVEESVALAAERLDVETALLDARHLAGDRDLSDRAAGGVLAAARSDPLGFAERLARSRADRVDRFGFTTYLLEPDLKEGAGGLRDLQSLDWIERVLEPALGEAGAELLRPRERAGLRSAEEFLWRARSALHLETGRRTDRLVLENQPPIARAMGFADEPGLIAVDGLMRALFEHARLVDGLADTIVSRRHRLTQVPAVDVRPSGAAGVVSLLAEREPSAGELDAIDAIDWPEAIEWTDEMRDAFLGLLRSERGRSAIETLDRLDLLGRLLPEWREVRCRPQRDPYHRFTADIHLLACYEEMSGLLGAGSSDPVEAEALRQIADRDALLLGALLHDIGKTGGGSHVEAGARIAAPALERMRLPKGTEELAQFLVERHLLLPDTATRRDLGDENLILDVAATIGTPERLAALYLLAKADALATGPAAWTPWRQTLIRELVAKVQRVFDRGEMEEALAEQLTDRIGRLRDLLAAEPEPEIERFVLRMPRGYFLTTEPADAARHFPLIAPALGKNEVRTASWSGGRPGAYELLVVAVDRPGLLSWIAGSLSLEGLSILTAQVFTTDDGEVVDRFEVEGVFDPDVGEEVWRDFRAVLRKTIEGRVSLEHRVQEKRRHYPPPRHPVPVTVSLDNDASDFFTVIEIGAADRIGLLYDITRTLAESGLDVHVAKVATYTGRVVDTFYVRDRLGRKVTDPAQADDVEGLLRARLEG